MERENLRALLRRRIAGFHAFHAWEENHPRVLPPGAAISAVSAIYDLLPEEVWTRRTPRTAEGIQELHRKLAKLPGRRGG